MACKDQPPGGVERRPGDPAQLLPAAMMGPRIFQCQVGFGEGQVRAGGPYFGSASSRPTAARNAGSAKIPVTL
jgi:hypothetical protein